MTPPLSVRPSPRFARLARQLTDQHPQEFPGRYAEAIEILRYLADVRTLPNESAKTHCFAGLIEALFLGSAASTHFAAGVEKIVRVESIAPSLFRINRAQIRRIARIWAISSKKSRWLTMIVKNSRGCYEAATADPRP